MLSIIDIFFLQIHSILNSFFFHYQQPPLNPSSLPHPPPPPPLFPVHPIHPSTTHPLLYFKIINIIICHWTQFNWKIVITIIFRFNSSYNRIYVWSSITIRGWTSVVSFRWVSISNSFFKTFPRKTTFLLFFSTVCVMIYWRYFRNEIGVH